MFDEAFVDIHGVRTNIHKYWCRTAQNKGISRADERVAGHDVLIPCIARLIERNTGIANIPYHSLELIHTGDHAPTTTALLYQYGYRHKKAGIRRLF